MSIQILGWILVLYMFLLRVTSLSRRHRSIPKQYNRYCRLSPQMGSFYCSFRLWLFSNSFHCMNGWKMNWALSNWRLGLLNIVDWQQPTHLSHYFLESFSNGPEWSWVFVFEDYWIECDVNHFESRIMWMKKKNPPSFESHLELKRLGCKLDFLNLERTISNR